MRWRSAVLGIILAAALLLAGCRPLVEDEAQSISVYATFYPIYALTEALMDGVPNAELHCLAQPQDGCLRSYALSDWDIYLLASSADAVIAGGRGLESFESTLFGLGDTGPAVSAILYNLELYKQGISHAQDENDSHLDGANPHLYMSIDGAKRMLETAAAMLMTLDPEYERQYLDNEAAAIAALDDLKVETGTATKEVTGGHVVLMNEALIYVAQDYGLEIADWMDRESGANLYDAELDDCLERLSKANARVVLIERQAPKPLTDALEAAGYSVALIDILATHREGEGFDTYLRAQRENAAAIVRAFDRAGPPEEAN